MLSREPRARRAEPEPLEVWRRRFGSRLLELRERLGWSQRELSRRTGLRTERLSRFEHGDRSPRLEELVLLRQALEVSFDQLLPGGSLEGADLPGALQPPAGAARWVGRCLIAAGQTLLEAHELQRATKAEAAP
jgi:transcriptional regulator with XRE-family HTH domain